VGAPFNVLPPGATDLVAPLVSDTALQQDMTFSFNLSECKGNYSATSKAGALALMGGLLHLIQRGGTGDWAGSPPAQAPPHCTKCNSPPMNGQYTNHRIAIGPLLCGFNVSIKG